VTAQVDIPRGWPALLRSAYRGGMATKAEIVIRVTSSRGGSKISYTSKGRYVSFPTTGYQRELLSQPIQPTSTLSAFWLSVIGAVLADITAHP